MIEMTDEQRQAVNAHPDEPVTVVDTSTRRVFVLLPVDVYERIRGLAYDDRPFPIQETYPLVDDMLAKAGWDDPAMDIYDDYASKDRP